MNNAGGENCALLELIPEKRWKRWWTKERCREKKKRKEEERARLEWRWRGCENGTVNGNVSKAETTVWLHRV
jgi:hypothetical protein